MIEVKLGSRKVLFLFIFLFYFVFKIKITLNAYEKDSFEEKGVDYIGKQWDNRACFLEGEREWNLGHCLEGLTLRH